MTSINPSDRTRIEESAASLVGTADHIRRKNGVLAGVYNALGKGIHGSHTAESGVHYLTFDLPEFCFVTIAGSSVRAMEGPLGLNIAVPGSTLFGETLEEQAATLRRNLNTVIGEVTASQDQVE